MHIALVIERFDPFAGGAERSTAQIAAELLRRGHRVTVLTSRCDDPGALPGAAVVTAPRRVGTSVGLLLFSRWIRRQLAEGPYDVSLSVTMAAPAMVLQPRGGTVRETLSRNVAMRRDPLRRGVKRAMIRLTPKYIAQLVLERRTLRDPMVRRVVAISRYVAEQLASHYAIDPRQVEMIPNAATGRPVDDARRRGWREAVRGGFGIGEEATVYLFAAMNPALKGFEPLLEATRRLEQRGGDPVLLLAGEFWYAHQRRVCELKLRDRVRFVRHTRRMDALYAAADATVLPTFYDPCSKVVIESLMAGVPAISSGHNGASDLIVPPAGEARGIVVDDPWDTAGLADAMAAMAAPRQRAAFAAATVGLDAELAISRHVDRLERVLREAAAEAAGEARARGSLAEASVSPPARTDRPGLH